MKTIKINPDETGWVKIDGSVRTIVAHFKDGHKETFSLVDFLTFKRRNLVVQIDCYEEGEEIKEDWRMTDKQKQAVEILNYIRNKKDSDGEYVMDPEQYLILLEFIVEQKTEIQYVPQPTMPWTTPDIRPYYGGTGDPLQPPYRITCELSKDWPMPKEQEQQTMEEYLLSQLDTPVVLKVWAFPLIGKRRKPKGKKR